MPRSDARHLPQCMRHHGEIIFDFPDDWHLTFNAVTLCNPNDINQLVLVKNCRHGHRLLQALLCPVDLFLLLLYGQQSHLKIMNNNPNDRTIFFHQSKILVQRFLPGFVFPLFTVFSEGFLLALVHITPLPVFVESALALVTEMFSKDGLQGAQTLHGADVAHHSDHHERGGLNDGNRLHLFTLCLLWGGNRTVILKVGVGHASLVSQEGGEVHRLAGVIFRPSTHSASVPFATLAGEKAQVSMAWCVKFAM
uniref:Uncharacterized protein n=1 Tax=Hippocampus comes TaxID=109280 RepID=A0A3Q2Y8L3_HIPCM